MHDKAVHMTAAAHPRTVVQLGMMRFVRLLHQVHTSKLHPWKQLCVFHWGQTDPSKPQLAASQGPSTESRASRLEKVQLQA